MRELSLHLLDVARNSVEAGAERVEIEVVEEAGANRLRVKVRDDGRGMDEAALAQARDPFYTTRTTRRWGLGLALFDATCRQCGGELRVSSRPGQGTVVMGWMELGHVDRPPLGDIGAVLQTLLCEGEYLALRYAHQTEQGSFMLDAEELRRELEEVPLADPLVLCWLREHVRKQLREIGSRA